MDASPTFLFVTCQVGAEAAVKLEVALQWPNFRFAYSRPGFLTFRLPPQRGGYPEDFNLQSIFARAFAFSLGKAAGETPEERARAVWQVSRGMKVDALHVWPRDTRAPAGNDKFEPGPTPASLATEQLIRQFGPANLPSGSDLTIAAPGTSLGQKVLDCVLVDEAEWWVGYHRVHSIPSSWPGGFMPGELPPHAVSRVYLKMLEGLVWSQLPIRAGETVVEFGSAPGGSSQVLLERGLNVIGVDPAEMHPDVLAHPRFRHVQMRSKEIRRREFVGVDWLTSDFNLPPKYTLDTVEAIVKHPGVQFKGLLLTLKLPQWTLVKHIPEYLERIRSWGFKHVRARQLQHNRQDICVAAT